MVSMASVADPDEPIALDFLATEPGSDDERGRGRPAGAARAHRRGVRGLAALWRFTPLAEHRQRRNRDRLGEGFGTRHGGRRSLVIARLHAGLLRHVPAAADHARRRDRLRRRGSAFSTRSSASSPRCGRDLLRGQAHAPRHRAAPGRTEARAHGRGAAEARPARDDAAAPGPLAPFVVVGIVAGAVRLKLWHLRSAPRSACCRARSPRPSSATSSRALVRAAGSTGGSSAALRGAPRGGASR